MADFAFNQAKGKAVEWAARVIADDPTNAIFILSLWNTTETDANLKDLDDIAAIESNANSAEITNSGYARKTFNQAAITVTIDDTNDWTVIDVADQTWTAVAAGTAITDAIFGYDSDSTAGTDSAIKPVSQHDFGITPDGSDITATIANFYKAA